MLIKAFNGKGENKVFVGEREVTKPANLAEAIRTYGEEKVLKGFWKSEVIAVQGSIRLGTNGGDPLVKAFKTATPEQKEKMLREAGIL